MTADNDNGQDGGDMTPGGCRFIIAASPVAWLVIVAIVHACWSA